MTSKLARALGCIATIALAHVTPTADAEVVAGAGTSCGSYSVVHINGVFISQSLAEDNVRALRTKHGDWYENTPVSFGLVYNPKGGFPGDLAEVLRQKSVEYPGATFVQMIRYLLSFAPGDLPSKLVNELATYWANWINNNGGSYNTCTDAGLPQMVDKVRAVAGSNTRVLLVPHSQGNLYANRIVEIVTTQAAPGYAKPVPAQSIGIMGVASPAAYQAGVNKMHATSTNDLVINTLRNGMPFAGIPPSAVLAAKFTAPLAGADPSGHGFTEIYLGTIEGESSVVGGIHALLGSLRSRVRWEPYGAVLFDAVAFFGSAERPVFVDESRGWATVPMILYMDEEQVVQYFGGDLEAASAANMRVAKACVARELAAWRRGDRLGICQSDKAEYRAWLFDLVGGDEVHLIEDRSVNPWRGSSTIWLSGVCRGWT